MDDVTGIIQRAADKAGFIRKRYIKNNVPTSVSNVSIFTFFGDIRSVCILSSLLLKRYREEAKGSRYFILCSYPGYEGLFPFVDEYWCVKEERAEELLSKSNGFVNDSDFLVNYVRNLNHFFEDVLDYENIRQYYDQGIKQEFFDRFKHIKRYLPNIPSGGILGVDFMRELTKKGGYKVFIMPTIKINSWFDGKIRPIKTHKEFWIKLADELLQRNITPVIYKGYGLHDISAEFTDCIYIHDVDILKVMGAMRQVGCVLDVFNGVSKLAIAARTPFVACRDRKFSIEMKDDEIDDLVGFDIPRDYVYTFPTILENNDPKAWEVGLLGIVLSRLEKLIADTNLSDLPYSGEVDEMVLYSKVRDKRVQKFGLKFIKNDC